jgi:flagellar protein FliS
MASVYEQYRQTSVKTASPEQLIVMLYDGALRFLEQARVNIVDDKDPSEAIGRTQDIIAELMASLDRSAGQIAENLHLLYEFWIQQLFKALIRRDLKAIEEVSSMVRDLRESWAIVAQQKRAAAVAAGPAKVASLNARS